ncbi:hypothetical protein BUALT_Bualt03G0141000 [Buddleja alternifolia]|uniref:Cyclin-dependent kinases regulatory subunit n=1 Tax=Buddleja alternifolia TaxID=168488 RepID=A0AAV6Y1Q1_9LAMI|nr:hypothetical protein BUALT_Bualt03G0141000 [Buddleja alternifolia]
MGQIQYSEKYFDDIYEYRHVVLPAEVAKLLPKNRLLSEGLPTANESSSPRYSSSWQGFILANYLFYSSLVMHFIGFAHKFLYTDIEVIVQMVAKVKCKLMKKANDSEVTDEVKDQFFLIIGDYSSLCFISSFQCSFSRELVQCKVTLSMDFNYLVTNLGILIG